MACFLQRYLLHLQKNTMPQTDKELKDLSMEQFSAIQVLYTERFVKMRVMGSVVG